LQELLADKEFVIRGERRSKLSEAFERPGSGLCFRALRSPVDRSR
jgi:hypothetical protein